MAVIENPPSDLITVSSHRGLHALVNGSNPLVPENSLQAVGLAAQAGLEMIELDVKLTSDGVPIMSHDLTWGRETCPAANSVGAFNPFVAQGSNSENDTLNSPVNGMTLTGALSSLTLRDTVSVIDANGSISSCSADYQNGKPYIYPSTLEAVLNFLTQNKIAMVLALDLRDAATAEAAWKVIAATPDYLGNSYVQSTLFKIPGKAFLNPSNPGVFTDTTVFANSFPPVNFNNPSTAVTTTLDYSDVHFQPVYNTGDIAQNIYGNEANIIAQLKAFETNSAIDVIAVEVQFKEPGGILSNVLSAARQNWATGGLETVSVFSPYVDYNYPSDPAQTPLFFTTSGYCCVPLSAFYYGPTMANPNGPNSPNPAIQFPTVPNPNYTQGQPTDTADERGNLSFVISQGYNSVTRDDAAQFVQLVAAAGDRNITYMQSGGPDPRCQPGIGQFPGCEADGLTTYTLCANNGGSCIFSGDRNIAYGANGIYTTLTFTNTVTCIAGSFPGATPGAGNSCYISPPISYVPPVNTGTPTANLQGYPVYCADEDQTCNFDGLQSLFGGGVYPYWAGNQQYSSALVPFISSGSYRCVPATFSSDPAPAYTNACFYLAGQQWLIPHPAPAGYGFCGGQDGTCPVQGTARIKYGVNGKFTTGVVNGATACNDATFGDPAPGYKKDCWVEATIAASPVTGSGLGQAGNGGGLGQSGSGGGAGQTGSGGALGQTGTNSQYVAQSIGVPAYFYPTPGASPNYWTEVTQTTPKVGFVVANVSNGPNFGVDPNYSAAIAATHNAGTKVLGYVDTGYFGGTSPARTTRLNQADVNSWTTQIEQDVDAWYSLYGSAGIDGIFFDDGQNVCGANNEYVTLYTDILNYVKQNHPGAYVVTNPGTAVPQCLENIADTLLTFEGSFDCYTNDSNCPTGQGYTPLSWTPVDPRKIYHIVYAVPSASLASISTLTKQNNAGVVFITDATLAGNPYGSLPSYLITEATDTAPALSDSTVPTPPTALATTSVSGTFAGLTWNSATDANGSGIVGYDVYQNGVKVTSVPASSSPQVTVTGLLPSTNYSFTVMARNAAGTVSAASNTLTFTTGANNGVVTAPNITNAVAYNNDATLNWSAAQVGSYPVAYYDVYLNGTKVITVDAGITNADVIALASSTSYSFTVQARDTEGDVSPMSNTVTLTTTSPSTPRPCTVAKTGASVSISCTYTSPWAFHHVYIDADSKSTTGFQFAWTTPAMGADYLIENTNFNSYIGNGTSFSWSTVASIQPVVTGSDTAGFVYTWTIPLSDFSGVPLGTPALYLMNGTGYAPEGYGTVLSK